jgi:cytoskeleton protein RodZ
VLWIVVLLLAAAAAFVLVPMQPGTPPAAEPKLDAAPAPVMPPSGAGATPSGDAPAAPATPSEPASGVVIGSGAAPAAVPVAVGNADTVAATATTTGAASAATPASSAFVSVADASLVLRALQPTWVQAVDGNGQTLMARLVPAGETVALSPALPVRLRIGNARGTELLFRGQPVNLATARDNIANITLP